ncbi:MAG: YsnF/AvaK domain-containing protein [Cyanobacteriota bacterium]
MQETPNPPDLGSTTPDLTSNPSPEISTAEQEVLSVIQEEVSFGKQQIERGKIRVNKRVESREEIVNAPIVHEQVVVERVPFNQAIEGEIPTERDENGIHIIPIFEEVAVAERQLILREEVRISKRLVTKNTQQVVAVQKGVVEIERATFESEPSNYIQPAVQVEANAQIDAQIDSQVDSQIDASANPAAQPIDPATQVENQVLAKPEETLAVASSAPSQSNQPQISNQISNPEAIVDNEIVIPIMAEEAALTVQQIARGKVQVRTRFDTVEQVLESPVMREELVIEHIPQNQVIQGDPPQIREENGVQIIPVLEEVLVSRKQLLLREEVRISKRRVTESIPQAITLRYEVADIEEISFEESRE